MSDAINDSAFASLDRRGFLTSAGVVALAAATTGTKAVAAENPSLTMAPALQPNYTMRALPFDPTKLPGLSEKMMRSHWENNYGGSVKALTAVKKRLAQMRGDKDVEPYVYNDLKREHLIRTGSVVLHELYFENLGGNGKAGTKERSKISEYFGSYDTWEAEFRRIGTGLGGGSGWVMLGFNQHLSLLENYWMADHASAPAYVRPVLVMDMYEHSYQMDYGAAAAKYIDAFFQNIQWEKVAQRIETA
jgi:Fe-Mn family superoxide dismutase